MSDIHFAGSILQVTQVQRQQEAQRSRDIRRQQELEKDMALQDEQLEHQVESVQEPTALPPHPADGTARVRPNLDLTA